jgi:glucan phosphoethanolaminetransferase (alkaline phosphatase superfamily)
VKPIEWLFVIGGLTWILAMLWECRHELSKDPINLPVTILLLAPIGVGLLPMWYGIKYSWRKVSND